MEVAHDSQKFRVRTYVVIRMLYLYPYNTRTRTGFFFKGRTRTTAVLLYVLRSITAVDTKAHNRRPSGFARSAPRALGEVRPPGGGGEGGEGGPPGGPPEPFRRAAGGRSLFCIYASALSKCASYPLVLSSCRRAGSWWRLALVWCTV